jgi:hypothetical protein
MIVKKYIVEHLGVPLTRLTHSLSNKYKTWLKYFLAVTIGGWQSSVLEGEEWRVTISSRHELLTSSDPDNKTVIIRGQC